MSQRAFSNPLRALWRLVAALAVTLYYIVRFHLTAIFRRGDASRHERSLWYTQHWARRLAWIMGLRISIKGEPPRQASLLTPNHMGYCDIIALASNIRTFFVAKAEIASWPLIGYIFRKSDHIIVSREDPRVLPDTIAEVRGRLEARHSVCVFLEGTSTGGDGVLPFMPPLTQAARAAAVDIVPVGVRWTPSDARIEVAEDIAYWKDHSFGPHAWRLLGFKRLEGEIAFGEPIGSDGRSRVELAEAARSRVVELAGLSGRRDNGAV